MSGIPNNAVTKLVAVDGWTLDVTDGEEPRVRDIELAERAGMKQPRDIRKVVERWRSELEEFGPLDMRVHCTRISKPRGGHEEREVIEFWLTEHQATAVLLQLRTPQARRLRVAVVKVFIAARRGQLVAPQPAEVHVPVLSTSPLVGDSPVHRDALAAQCRAAAAKNGSSVHQIHGVLRRQFRAPGVYQIPLVFYLQARDLLAALGDRRLLLPPGRRHLALVPESPPSTQAVLPFPGTDPEPGRA